MLRDMNVAVLRQRPLRCWQAGSLFIMGHSSRRLIVVALETGGRWSSEAVDFVTDLARALARTDPLRGSAFFAWRPPVDEDAGGVLRAGVRVFIGLHSLSLLRARMGMYLTWPISSLREAKVSSGNECDRWFFAFRKLYTNTTLDKMSLDTKFIG